MWCGSLCVSDRSPATLGSTFDTRSFGSSAVQMTLPKVAELGSTSTTARKSCAVVGSQTGVAQPSADHTSSTDPFGIVSPVFLLIAAGAPAACAVAVTTLTPRAAHANRARAH